MEDLVETLTRGNTAEVKVLLASIALALGVYSSPVIFDDLFFAFRPYEPLAA